VNIPKYDGNLHYSDFVLEFLSLGGRSRRKD
jgi:hypothetical protein